MEKKTCVLCVNLVEGMEWSAYSGYSANGRGFSCKKDRFKETKFSGLDDFRNCMAAAQTCQDYTEV